MPLARSLRQCVVVSDKNDENGGTIRLTRAKAAALAMPDKNSTTMKKPLQSKKFTNNTLNATNPRFQRQRAAFGDVSNVNKSETIEAKNGKDVKKLLNPKPGLVSKATQNAGVQKLSRASSSRLTLGTKDNNNKKATSTELKRPASGSDVMGGLQKGHNITSTSTQESIKEATPALDTECSKKIFAVEIEKRVDVEVKEEVKVVKVEEQISDAKQVLSQTVKDLDLKDADDPLMVAEYVVEIFDYLRVLEDVTMPNAHYMDHQDDLEWKMRGILVDWLIEVHTQFHLKPETLFLAVNIIDRFLSATIVELDCLQLIGVTAMFIASKYEESPSPHVANFRHVADDGFTEAEILSAERYVLAALNYDLSYPNPMNFLRRISKADSHDIQTRTLGKYLIEISLVDHRFMKYHPSRIAAAAMYLARLILDREEWGPTLTHYAGYNEEEIQPVFKLMVDYLYRPVAHKAFFRKYASKKFLKASIVTRQWAKTYYPMFLDTPSDAGHGKRSPASAT